jgi:pimeloyl-ACP methyl ester carboxylesterase
MTTSQQEIVLDPAAKKTVLRMFTYGLFDYDPDQNGDEAAWARALADPLSDQAERSSYIPMLREPAAADMLAGNGGAGLRAGFEGTGLVGHDLDEYLAVLTEPTAIQAALNWYRAYDFHRGGVGDIAVPTLYVWSSGDNAIAREGAEWTGEYIRAPYQFEILDDVCHWVLDVQPERISELLEQQLGSVKAP